MAYFPRFALDFTTPCPTPPCMTEQVANRHLSVLAGKPGRITLHRCVQGAKIVHQRHITAAAATTLRASPGRTASSQGSQRGHPLSQCGGRRPLPPGISSLLPSASAVPEKGFTVHLGIK